MNLLFRFNSWWKKLSGFLCLLYLEMTLKIDFTANIENLALIIIGLVLGAILTSFINDYYDLDIDKRAGKVTFFMGKKPVFIRLTLLLGIAACFVYLWTIRSYPWAVFFYILALICVFLYSSFLFRFKEKPGLDLLFDGLGTQFFPALFCLFLFGSNISVLIWGCFWLFFANGARSLLIHQNKDREKDEKVGLKTFVLVTKNKDLMWIFLGLEILCFVLLLLQVNSMFLLACLLFFGVLTVFQNREQAYTFFELPKLKHQRIFLFDVYVFLPLIVLTYNSFFDQNYLFLLGAHILLFHSAFVYQAFCKIFK